jgi:hypothetical protein
MQRYTHLLRRLYSELLSEFWNRRRDDDGKKNSTFNLSKEIGPGRENSTRARTAKLDWSFVEE